MTELNTPQGDETKTRNLEKTSNQFLSQCKENLKIQQYWFSKETVAVIVAEIQEFASKVAFLSTPSVYFSLTSIELKKNSSLFEYDEQWSADPGFVKFDYNKVEDIPKKLHHSFDYVVIDPPCITPEVWEKYIEATMILLPRAQIQKKHKQSNKEQQYIGKILGCTVAENHKFLSQSLGLFRQRFRPSIPNLLWQYSFFCNYESIRLAQLNPAIDNVTPPLNSRKKCQYGSISSDNFFLSEQDTTTHSNQYHASQKTDISTFLPLKSESAKYIPILTWKLFLLIVLTVLTAVYINFRQINSNSN